MFDLETRTAGRLADPRTLVSALETGDGGQIIALIDVARPDEPKIGDVLWKRGPELDVAPR